MKRNPKWHRDEIILALDLYFSKDKSSEKISELSNILNKLPHFVNRPDEEKFRNTNGVTLKLANFRAVDPTYVGVGMRGGSALDKKLFFEYYDRKQELHEIAKEIRTIAKNDELTATISKIEDDEQTINDSVIEGQILYKLHKVKERDKYIVVRKKNQCYTIFGKLSCEACTFDFENYYGEIGKGFIECHHRTPLAQIKAETLTRLEDLALLCSNCHRMIHRKLNSISVEDLRMMIKYDRI